MEFNLSRNTVENKKECKEEMPIRDGLVPLVDTAPVPAIGSDAIPRGESMYKLQVLSIIGDLLNSILRNIY